LPEVDQAIAMDTQYKIIPEEHPAQGALTLLLNGRFSEDSLNELEEFISEARGSHQKIYLDLSEVTLVDRKAVQYLSQQARRNVELVNCPIYLRRWISVGTDEAGN
jgi:anti-anti-sigma regulatory factor